VRPYFRYPQRSCERNQYPRTAALAVTVDVRLKEQVQNMVKQTIQEFGQIDVLVNDAGIGRNGLIVDLSEEDWDAVVDTSLKGTFLVCKPWAGI